MWFGVGGVGVARERGGGGRSGRGGLGVGASGLLGARGGGDEEEQEEEGGAAGQCGRRHGGAEAEQSRSAAMQRWVWDGWLLLRRLRGELKREMDFYSPLGWGQVSWRAWRPGVGKASQAGFTKPLEMVRFRPGFEINFKYSNLN